MYNVTVGPKTPYNRYYNEGSKQCYYINGIEAPVLKLCRGEKYTFNINTPSHPFTLTVDEVGGKGPNMQAFTVSTEKGMVDVFIDETFPDYYAYSCANHERMGNSVESVCNTFYLSPFVKDLHDAIQIRMYKLYYYIAEQKGLLYRLNSGSLDLVLDLRKYIPKLDPKYDERGLLDFLFHKGKLIVFYSVRQSRDDSYSNSYNGSVPTVPNIKGEAGYYNCLSVFDLDKEDIPIVKSEQPLLKIPMNYNFHCGGRMEIGPDNYLYLGIGDGGPQEDTYNHAQDLSLLYGKIIRIDLPFSQTPYRYNIPSDNPFRHIKNARPEIYAYGIRNPWGLTFENKGKRRLFVTDAGYNNVEEVDIIIKGGNYGWNIKEGSRFTNYKHASRNINQHSLIEPIYEYTHDDKRIKAIVGGAFNNKDGDYIFADYGGFIWRIREERSNKWVLVENAIIDAHIYGISRVGDKLFLLAKKTNSSIIYELDVV